MSYAVRLLPFFAAFAAFLTAGTPAFASDRWTLVQAVGEVSVAAPGATPVAAKPSSPLPDGATVRTGASGRAVLLRGRETIVMSPSSVLTLPGAGQRDFTKVKQVSGTLLFKIGKKPEAHFEVDTPYLAAVVKGTTFTVKVASSGASVHVLEGAVEVATPDRKRSFLTRAGQISSVFAKAAGDIFTTGASVLNGPAGNSELWGTDVSGFEFGGASSNWGFSNETRVIQGTGLKASNPKPDKVEQPSPIASQRTLVPSHPESEKTAASPLRAQKQKPKNEPVRTADASEESTRERERPVADGKPAAAKTSDIKAKDPVAPKSATTAPSVEKDWTITQAKGAITIDGYPFTNFGDGAARTLPSGTKVETGADGRLGVAYGMREFIVDANSLVILGDAAAQTSPKVVSGQALEYREASGRYEAVPNLTEEEIARLRAEGLLNDAPQGGGPAGALATAPGSGLDGKSVTSAPDITPRLSGGMPGSKTKTEEVRTKVISGLTLGLYGLTALLVLAFGAQWLWRRYRAKAKSPAPESAAQTRLRTIKGA